MNDVIRSVDSDLFSCLILGAHFPVFILVVPTDL